MSPRIEIAFATETRLYCCQCGSEPERSRFVEAVYPGELEQYAPLFGEPECWDCGDVLTDVDAQG